MEGFLVGAESRLRCVDRGGAIDAIAGAPPKDTELGSVTLTRVADDAKRDIEARKAEARRPKTFDDMVGSWWLMRGAAPARKVEGPDSPLKAQMQMQYDDYMKAQHSLVAWDGQLCFLPDGRLRSSWDIRGRWVLLSEKEVVTEEVEPQSAQHEVEMTLGGRQYQVWFTSDEEGHWAFKAECNTGDKHIGRFIWSPNTHREQGLDSSGGFNWLPGTQWRWVQIEEDLVQFLPQGWLRTREDHCAHWHQLEGHGECCIYVSGRRYHAQFEETTKHAEGISARTFTAKQLSGKMHFGLSEVSATKCLPLPTTERGVTCGYIMKRSGLLMSEWKARCHPPNILQPLFA